MSILSRIFNHNKESLRDAMEDLLEEIPDNIDAGMSVHEHDLLSNVLALNDLRAKDLMIPRVDIVAINQKKSIADLAHLMMTKGRSRIPVYKDSLDNIIGIAHDRDVLGYLLSNKPVSLDKIVEKEVVFVSPAMRALDILKEMQLKHTHIVLVVDEYGGIDGIITDQDLMERIVGELDDAHDYNIDPELIPGENGSFEADAKVILEELEEKMGTFLTKDERETIDTIGGLAFYLSGRIPAKGEVITHSSGIKLRIISSTPRQVVRLTIFPKSKATSQ